MQCQFPYYYIVKNLKIITQLKTGCGEYGKRRILSNKVTKKE